VITDQNGNRKEQMEYFPFGTYRAFGIPTGTYDFDANFPDVFYTFTGQEEDDELGLYNFKARLYDPVIGRFISADTIVPNPEDPQSLNRYSYCLNNPLRYIDPTGNEETDPNDPNDPTPAPTPNPGPDPDPEGGITAVTQVAQLAQVLQPKSNEVEKSEEEDSKSKQITLPNLKADKIGFWGQLLGYAFAGSKTGWGAFFGPAFSVIGALATGYDTLNKGLEAVQQPTVIQNMEKAIE